jgi:hypothetical protein
MRISFISRSFRFFSAPLWFRVGSAILIVALSLCTAGSLPAQQGERSVEDATGKYHFLGADDTLGILEEEGKIKGYIDVTPEQEESDDVLSYAINLGSRQGNHIEFKTAKIHQKYYRFSGTVERGTGKREGDPDYARLVGDLTIVTAHSDAGTESKESKHVVFKSMGKNEGGEENQK